jgi:nucleoid DNA-binding protein/flagellar basal body-associated protein FliL
MNNRLTAQDIAGLLAKKTGKDQTETAMFLKEWIEAVSAGVFADKTAKVNALGTFKIVKVKDRESVNISTGERFLIPGHYKFNFTPDKELKESVNKPFAVFATTEITGNVPETEAKEKEEQKQEPETEAVTEEPETEEEITEKEEIKIAEKEEIPVQIQTVEDKPVENKTKKGDNRHRKVIISILSAAFIIIAGIGVYFLPLWNEQVSISLPPETVDVEANEPVVPEPEQAIAGKEATVQPAQPTQTGTTIARVKIREGSRLTLLALEYYKEKVFWVYIYEYNKALIPNPGVIPVGTELAIPAPEVYGINAGDPASVGKATRKQAEIMNALE